MVFHSKIRLLISTLCLLSLSTFISGQSYRFKNYNLENGLPNEFVYSIVQDNNGYLWIGTGSGLSKFDGFDFYNIQFPDSSEDRYPTASLKDRNGRLWFGCNDGSVYYADNNKLKPVSSASTSITAILQSPDSSVFIIPQINNILKIDPRYPDKAESFPVDEGMLIFSACFTPQGEILLGTQENITLCRIEKESIVILDTISGFDYSSVTAIHSTRDTNTYLAGTNGNGLFLVELEGNQGTLSKIRNAPDLEMLDIQSITEDVNRDLLISTNGSGVVRLNINNIDGTVGEIKYYNEASGLPGNNVRLVFRDLEQNYWIGLFGDGLSVLNSLAFSFFTPGTTPETNEILYISRISDDYLLGTPAGFWLFDIDGGKAKSFNDLRQVTEKYKITSYFVDQDENIWIGTNGGGVYIRDLNGKVRLFYRNGNKSEDYVTDIELNNKYIWLGTLNGVILLERNGTAYKFINRFNNTNGLPHNSISQIFITTGGDAAIAMETDRLYTIDPASGVIRGKAVMAGTTRNGIVSFAQSGDGHLWAATKGNGIFEFFNDSLRSYTKADNLMSDFCYSILSDSTDRIWIGHDRGFSRYNTGTGVLRKFGTDFAKGGLCTPDGMFESDDGKVLIGTTEGFIVYDRKKDVRPQTAPLNNINYISINDSIYPLKSSYVLPYSRRYNIEVGYVGINLKDPDKVYYETMLENWDSEWSPLTDERTARLAPVDGRYRFLMNSVSEDGLSGNSPVSFELFIKKPYWRTWWFILSILTLISTTVIIVVREREKAQKKIRDYLEKELEARTSVVLKQKDKIELQNIEITDSINYAKRIQTSILPDFARLKETFMESFILFKPRDIVSGDFYWFDKFSEEKFMLVCADSTGHGVPGAFMSMIGSTLLQDIVSRQRITKPSEVLTMLDKQIFSTLNQNLELGVSNDGMDMVVCEINPAKRYIRFASAMRPVILVLDGEPLYVKGNRCSIGGESVIEKYFDDQEYYLNEGDTIYMFSDGLPDQFGGNDGKKLKIARLKKLIEDVANLPLSGQKEVIGRFYEEWKGEYEQVDDILLIGVRL